MISNWISSRISEASTHQGIIVVAAAVAALFFGALLLGVYGLL